MSGELSLMSVVFLAPLVVVRPRFPDELHGATMESIVECWDRGWVRSACGQLALKLVSKEQDGSQLVARWPPPARSLPEGMKRCRECYVAIPQKRIPRWPTPMTTTHQRPVATESVGEQL